MTLINNSRGPRMELWGTPQEIFPKSDSLFTISTKKYLVTKIGPETMNTLVWSSFNILSVKFDKQVCRMI